MISGRQALGQITGLKREQQGELTGLDQKIEELGRQLLTLRQHQAEDYRALSRLRLDVIADDSLGTTLDAAERDVAAMLERRDARAGTLQQRIAEARGRLRDLEQQREELADQVDAANARLQAAEAATDARLTGDPDWQAHRDQAQEAARTASHAAEKARASAEEQAAKGAAYADDPLFMYLWRRRFGTPDYRANPIARWLDAKVARLIRYADAAPNYQRLLDLPPRLQEHAGRLAAQAEAAADALARVTAAAQAADGIPPLVEARDSAALRVQALDQDIAAAEAAVSNLLNEEARLAAGDDDETRAAVDKLASALSRADLAELRRAALATPFPEDDAICARLEASEQEVRRIGFMLDNLKQTRAAQQRRLNELDQVEREFRQRRMDQDGGGFADSAMVTMMLANLVKGVLDRDALIRVLEQQHQAPSRSSGSVGFPGTGGWGGGGWGGGGGRGSGGLGGGGGGSGGGFRTGGGF